MFEEYFHIGFILGCRIELYVRETAAGLRFAEIAADGRPYALEELKGGDNIV
jgi:hypothetical protein